MSRVNWPVLAMGVLWWYAETSYFGWNLRPGSIAELFADGMGLGFYALAFALPRKQPSVSVVVVNTTPKEGGDA